MTWESLSQMVFPTKLSVDKIQNCVLKLSLPKEEDRIRVANWDLDERVACVVV